MYLCKRPSNKSFSAWSRSVCSRAGVCHRRLCSARGGRGKGVIQHETGECRPRARAGAIVGPQRTGSYACSNNSTASAKVHAGNGSPRAPRMLECAGTLHKPIHRLWAFAAIDPAGCTDSTGVPISQHSQHKGCMQQRVRSDQ